MNTFSITCNMCGGPAEYEIDRGWPGESYAVLEIKCMDKEKCRSEETVYD